MVESELFDKGLETRRQVLGSAYVDANLAGSDEFMMTFQRAVTELAWGYAWSRPGLDLKVRSILTLGIHAKHFVISLKNVGCLSDLATSAEETNTPAKDSEP